jgi:FKBP-type peptidyl-prolyl cis-trans isomerase SlyD
MMSIEKNKVVSVNYLLTKKNTGDVIEETSTENPFVFLFGVGGLLEDFESNLIGKHVGDTFDFFIDHERGYGVRDEQFVTNVPIEAFLDDEGNIDEENVFVGNTLPMVDNNGEQLLGTVVAIDEASVRMDFNHPLAGQDLHFKGEVLEIRDASPEELEHGHVHGAGGHHHH